MSAATVESVLVFQLGGRRFGLPLASVREVIRAVAMVGLPGAPPVVEGVIDLRGTAVPVLDLRARFGLPPRRLSPDDFLVTARAGERLVAVRVDAVEWLVPLDPARIDDPADLTDGVRHIAGIAHLDDGMVLIHDIETFLEQAESEALERALAGGREGAGE
jgi:purine-binding chemotaxis protein CheW